MVYNIVKINDIYSIPNFVKRTSIEQIYTFGLLMKNIYSWAIKINYTIIIILTELIRFY